MAESSHVDMSTQGKYILIGNSKDGFVNVKEEYFKDFETLKEILPDVMMSLRGFGQWEVTLYEVPVKPFIKLLPGNYRVPENGQRVFTYSYQNLPIKAMIFSPDKMVIVCEAYQDKEIQRGNALIKEQYTHKEDITVLLDEPQS